MNGATLQKPAADCAEELPGAGWSIRSGQTGRSTRCAARFSCS